MYASNIISQFAGSAHHIDRSGSELAYLLSAIDLREREPQS